MTRVPLRIVLTLVFAGAMAVVLGTAGWFVYDRVASDLATSLDQELRARAQDLSALVRHGGSLRTTRGRLVEDGESFAELVSGDGRVIDATPPIGTQLLLTRDQLRDATRKPAFVNRSSAPGLDEGARMLALPVKSSVLVVGLTRENRAEALRSLRNAFLIGGPIALLVASLLGYALAGAALRPIESMRRRAAAISAASLGERLPVPPADDEVARLGATLNAMLARIEQGLERERRFVADASHELRTPLALLKTELELALRRARSSEELEQALRSAAATTDRLARLADDLLLLARAEAGTVPLDVAPIVVSDVFDTVAARFAARAELENRELVVAGEDAIVVRGDRLRLEQALTNMVDNAFAHGRGTVQLSARTLNGTVELHVRDDGRGFPDDFVGRAFERFSRGETDGVDGSGLGLAIVDTIARAHNGSTGIRGADVWIALPATPSPARGGS